MPAHPFRYRNMQQVPVDRRGPVHIVRVSLDEDRRWRNRVICAVVVVVVAVVVVAVTVVIDAVHDDHPFLLDPFPRADRAIVPCRNGRPRAIARMVRDVAVSMPGRRRMMVRRRPCGRMACDSMRPRHIWLSALPTRRRFGGRPCRSRFCGGGPCRLPIRGRFCGGPCCRSRSRLIWRSALSTRCGPAMAAASGSGECRGANCRTGDSDDHELHVVVVVHSTPSLSVWGFQRRAHLALTPSKVAMASFPDKHYFAA